MFLFAVGNNKLLIMEGELTKNVGNEITSIISKLKKTDCTFLSGRPAKSFQNRR
jgi:hypothetical protein